MKVFCQLWEFQLLLLLSIFTSATIRLASCSSLPIPITDKSTKRDLQDPPPKEIFGVSETTPESNEVATTEYPQNTENSGHLEFAIKDGRMSALESLQPAINPMNADGLEKPDPFFLPIVYGRSYGNWGRPWYYRQSSWWSRPRTWWPRWGWRSYNNNGWGSYNNGWGRYNNGWGHYNNGWGSYNNGWGR